MEKNDGIRVFTITKSGFRRLLKAYLPESFFEKVNLSCLDVEQMDLDSIGENGGDYVWRLAMESPSGFFLAYEPLEEFVANLKAFSDIPNVFEELWEPYRSTPKLFSSFRRKELMSKQDTFIKLQNLVFSGIGEFDEEELPRILLTLFLKNKQKAVEPAFEFFNAAEFKSIEAKFKYFAKKFGELNKHQNSKPGLVNGTPNATIVAFEDLLRKHGVSDDDSLAALHLYFSTRPPTPNKPFAAYVRKFDALAAFLNSLIAARPTVFTLAPAVRAVRVFTDGNRKFVMRGELFKALQCDDPLEPAYQGYLTTVELSEVYQIFQNHPDSGQIELILTPIRRTRHRAVPIHIPDGKLCKLAIDVLTEMLQELIFGLRVFHALDIENSMERIWDFFGKLPEWLDMNLHSIYFIRLEECERINRKVQETFADFKPLNPPIKLPKSLGESITLRIVYAHLHPLFAKTYGNEELAAVTIVADLATAHLQPANNEILRAFATIANVIRMLMVNQFPKINKFVHYQNGCHRIFATRCCDAGTPRDGWESLIEGSGPIDFQSFVKKAKDSEGSGSSDPLPVHKQLSRSERKKIFSEVVLERIKASLVKPQTPEEPKKKVSMTSNPIQNQNQNKKKKKKTKEYINIRKPIVPDGSPESKVCEKCFRTSEACREEKQKLSDAKGVIGQLKRQVKDLKKEVEMRDEEAKKGKKEASGCGKCRFTSEMCEEAKKETKGFRNKVETLEKKLTAAEKEAKEKMQLLNLEKEKLSTTIEEKDRIIRTLKQMVPRDALAELPRTSEMGKVFFDLQMKLNEMRTLDPLGNMERQVAELKGRTQEPMIRQFAEVQRLEFRVGYERYSTAIDRNIAMMQADPLLTREDLLPVPEFPSLSTVFYEQLSAAREANNAQLDRECFICTDHLELEEWTKCPDCTLKFHVSCKNDWYKNPENRVTPCCRRA